MLSLFQSSLVLISIFTGILILSFFYTKYNKKVNFKKELLRNFMGFIFIIFGLLKLYDLKKFVNIFSKYDIISKKIRFYPFLYPFLEILIGLLLIKNIKVKKINIIIVILMLISILSVLFSFKKGQDLRCGCLGSFFHIPLSYVTLSENIIMLIMSIPMLKENIVLHI